MSARCLILWANAVTFTVSTLGCSVTINRHVHLTKQELTDTAERDAMLPGPIVEAGFSDGVVVEFGPSGATYSVQTNMVRGTTKDRRHFERDASELSYVVIKTVNQAASTGVTVLLWVGVAVVIVGLLYAALASAEIDLFPQGGSN